MRAVQNSILLVLRFAILFGVLSYATYWLWQQRMPADTQGLSVEIVFQQTQDDADCVLLRQGEAVMMIDTGEEVDGGDIVAALARRGIERIDLLILTHTDADHIGGAAQVLEGVEVGRVIMPQYNKESARLEELRALLAVREVPVTLPTRTRRYTVGEMKVLIYPPLEGHYNKDNNYSLATLVTHGSVNMVFAGDADEKRLRELMNISWPNADLYKVAHHGRASNFSGDFIRMLAPLYAVSTSRDSDEEIKQACKAVGAQLLYTGEGNVEFRSDGVTLRYFQNDQEEGA